MTATPPTFSPATVKALVDVITAGAGMCNTTPPIGIYRTATKIQGLMMECDLDFRVGSSRVSSLMDDLRLSREADPHGGEKLARIVLRVAEPEDYAAEPERQQAVVS